MFTRQSARAGALVAAGALVIGALAGCSTDPAGDDPSDSPTTATINWWFWNPDESQQDLYIDAFEADHPDIKVVPRKLQFADYVNALRLGATSSDGPDVFGIQGGSLTEQFASLAVDLAPLAEAELGSDWADQLSAEEQLVSEGKQVGLPWNVTGSGTLWYNAGLLNELGLQKPATLEELAQTCEVARAQDIDCISHGALDAWVNIDVYQAIINQLAPGAFYEAQDGERKFTDPEFIEAFTIWATLFDDNLFTEGALAINEYPDADDEFKQGRALYFAGGGTWESSSLTTTGLERLAEKYDSSVLQAEFGVMAFPAVKDSATTGRLFGGPDVGWAISSASENQEAAWKFVSWMSAGEAGQKLVAERLQQPALSSVSLDYSDVVTDTQRSELDEVAQQLADLIGPRQVKDADVEAALGVALSSVAAKTQTAEDAAADVQAAIEAAQQ